MCLPFSIPLRELRIMSLLCRHGPMRNIFRILLIALILSSYGCAKRGTPSGGEKDTTPPVLLKSEPAMGASNFKEEKIRLYFDEFIKFKKLQDQLIISPPLKNTPIIKPQGSASRMVEIQLFDTLLENTTYSINFGNALVDNNEENPYPFLQYVFSTGDRIDSLELKGAVKDAFNRKADPYVTLMLYPNDSVYNDSLVYNEPPRYVGSTGDSLPIFNLNYLAGGSYRVFAIKDNNKNNRYDPYLDKIGYLPEPIALPNDSLYLIELFKEKVTFKASRPKLEGSNHFLIPYESDIDSIPTIEIINRPDSLWTYVEKVSNKDSLNLWFKPAKFDSLQVVIQSMISIDTFTVKPVKVAKDTLTLSSVYRGSIPPFKSLSIGSSTPLAKVDRNFISFYKQDSIPLDSVDLSISKMNNRILESLLEPEENTTYRVRLLPGALEDHFGNTNDTISIPFRFDKLENFGVLKLQIEPVFNSSIEVSLLDKEDQVIYQQPLDSLGRCEFNAVKPGIYDIRLLFDTTKNGRYDTGSFLNRIHPERILYLNESIEIRANWEENRTYKIQN